MEEFARLITPLPPMQMRAAAPASSPRLPVRLSANFQASTAVIDASCSFPPVFLMFPRKGTGLEHPDALLRDWRGEFTAQYKRGRYFHMRLHPQHIGWSNRLQMLDECLPELRGYPSL
jgi:hypothetical protein